MPIEKISQQWLPYSISVTTSGPTWKAKKLTSIICLDLSAAFDTLNHSILLEVMENYFVITYIALDWISSCLKNRKFSVHIDSFSSNTKTINFSLPQSSILGPTLFNCYVSTLMEIIPETEDNFVSGYADDHALINTFHPDNTDISPKLVSTSLASKTGWIGIN